MFWVNAKDEVSLRQAMVYCRTAQNREDKDIKVEQVRWWLSKADNDKWLMIFDNYDDPNIPGVRSPTGYDIRSFFPHRPQGSIVITTRSPKLSFGKQLRLQKLRGVKTGLAVLSQRSGRDLSDGRHQTRLL